MDGHLRIGFGSDPGYLESALALVGEFLASAPVERSGALEVPGSDRGKGVLGTQSPGMTGAR